MTVRPTAAIRSAWRYAGKRKLLAEYVGVDFLINELPSMELQQRTYKSRKKDRRRE